MGTRVTVGTFSPSVLLRIARRTGELERAGLDVEERAVPSSPAQFRSLIDGALDVALTSPDNVIAYRYSPANPLATVVDAQIVAGIDRGLGLALYGRPPASTSGTPAPFGVNEQVTGRAPAPLDRPPFGSDVPTFGVDVPTSGFAFAMYALAESLGLSRDHYRLATLGSTPKRLAALLAGECDATMLNAGNDLQAERAGCPRLAGIEEVARPYLGTVLAVVGPEHLEPATRLAGALRATAAAICGSELDDLATDVAVEALDLPPEQARRYRDRLKDPDQGLLPDGRVDLPSLRSVVDLRRRYRAGVVDGEDRLAQALVPGSGLLATTARVR